MTQNAAWCSFHLLPWNGYPLQNWGSKVNHNWIKQPAATGLPLQPEDSVQKLSIGMFFVRGGHRRKKGTEKCIRKRDEKCSDERNWKGKGETNRNYNPEKKSNSTKGVSLLQCCFMRRKNVSFEKNEYLVNGFLCVCCVSYHENIQFYAFLIYLSALN